MVNQLREEGKVAPTASTHTDQQFPQPAQGPTLNGPVGAGMSAGGISGGKQSNARNELVREIIEEQNLSLPAASKYMKENNLYTR